MRKGYVLIAVLVVIIVLSSAFISISNMTLDNSQTINRQENMAKAHFLSRSAIDLAYSALMESSSTPGYVLKIDLFKANTSNVLNDTVTFPEGVAVVDVYHDGSFIAIRAVTSLTGITGNATLTMRINKTDYTDIRWN